MFLKNYEYKKLLKLNYEALLIFYYNSHMLHR